MLSRRSSLNFGLELLLTCVLLSGTACERRHPKVGQIRVNYKTPQAAPEKVAARVPGPGEPDLRYQTFVRPMMNRRGCTAGPCHAGQRGGGFSFRSGQMNDTHDYQQVLERVDHKNPEASELLRKATNKVQHNGGLNITVGSCDYKRLVAWIGDRPDIDCSDEPPPDPQRFAREVAPALQALGCVGCHSQNLPARSRLNLAPLSQTPPNVPQALESFVSTHPTPYMSWQSAIIRAAAGQDGKHSAKANPKSCAYRRLYGYIAGSPELSCSLTDDSEEKQLPDYEVFAKTVLPSITPRGCGDVSCHGGGAGGMSLYGIIPGQSDGWHEYLAFTARVEDFAHVDKSTFLTTVRNEVPHGGGQRMGGAGDCVDSMIVAWLTRQTVKPCPPPSPPSYERFVAEVQPVLDRMTCTNAKCHGSGKLPYRLTPHAAAAAILRTNYENTLKRIDMNFMAFSEIQLRMREPCAYSIVASWITKKPRPDCQLKDPDPSIFPKMSADEPPTHPKFSPGAPTKG